MTDERVRLDQLAAAALDCTRSRAEKLIREGRVRAAGKTVTKPGERFPADTPVEADIPEPVPAKAQPEDLPLDILYEDDDLAVVVKPEGMVVHPANGNETGTLVNALLGKMEFLSGLGGEMRPGIVHRLDKDTSGLLLVAKNDRTHAALSDALKERAIHKTYLAAAWGHFREPEGFVEAPIGRDPRDRKKMAVVPDGRFARTEYRVAETYARASLLHVRLITGRTHQIRVHLRHIGHPLLGDPVYAPSDAAKAAGRLMLHAWRVAFIHPATGLQMEFEAPVPDSFAREIKKLRSGGFAAMDP